MEPLLTMARIRRVPRRSDYSSITYAQNLLGMTPNAILVVKDFHDRSENERSAVISRIMS